MSAVLAPFQPQTLHADITEQDSGLSENFPVGLGTLSRCSPKPRQ